jgi:hypothetical protein
MLMQFTLQGIERGDAKRLVESVELLEQDAGFG